MNDLAVELLKPEYEGKSVEQIKVMLAEPVETIRVNFRATWPQLMESLGMRRAMTLKKTMLVLAEQDEELALALPYLEPEKGGLDLSLPDMTEVLQGMHTDKTLTNEELAYFESATTETITVAKRVGFREPPHDGDILGALEAPATAARIERELQEMHAKIAEEAAKAAAEKEAKEAAEREAAAAALDAVEVEVVQEGGR